MNVRDAILATASFLQAHPEKYDYLKGDLAPDRDCGTPHCVLGWMAGFRKVRKGNVFSMAPDIIGVNYHDWANAMDALSDRDGRGYRPDYLYERDSWRQDSVYCAQLLRQYADKFHPDAKPSQTAETFIADLMTKVTGPRIPEDA